MNRWFMSVNHKDIGSLYILLGLSFGLVGSALSGIIRLELNTMGHSIMDGHGYNVVVTGHGLITIFFFVMPMLIGGFGNWLIPLMMGTPDMAWPRLNNFSFWLLVPSSMCLLHGLFQGGIGSGWTMYPPLSARETPMDAMIFSLHLAGMSSIFGAINFITTMFMNGPKGFMFYNYYLYLWCMAVTTFMLITTLPVLAAAITMLLFDRHFNSSFFNVTGGGDPILFQHLFWFFGHPEVYVLILPGFGMLSHVVAFNCGLEKPFGYYGMAWSIITIGILGFMVWAHHMFSVGMDTDSKGYFSAATVVIGLPTGVKVFGWIAHFNMSALELTFEVAWGYFFIWLFTFGPLFSLVCPPRRCMLGGSCLYFSLVSMSPSCRSVFSNGCLLLGPYFLWCVPRVVVCLVVPVSIFLWCQCHLHADAHSRYEGVPSSILFILLRDDQHCANVFFRCRHLHFCDLLGTFCTQPRANYLDRLGQACR